MGINDLWNENLMNALAFFLVFYIINPVKSKCLTLVYILLIWLCCFSALPLGSVCYLFPKLPSSILQLGRPSHLCLCINPFLFRNCFILRAYLSYSSKYIALPQARETDSTSGHTYSWQMQCHPLIPGTVYTGPGEWVKVNCLQGKRLSPCTISLVPILSLLTKCVFPNSSMFLPNVYK